MANSVNRPRRPWELPKRNFNKMQGQGRLIVTKFYKSREWKLAREEHLRENPFCVECLKEGVRTLGNVVDHKKQINRIDPYDTQNGRYPDPLDPTNFQTMCMPHHNKKSAKERHGKS